MVTETLHASLSTGTLLHVVWRIGACTSAGASKRKPAEQAKAAGHARARCMHGRPGSLPEHELKLLGAHLRTPLEDKCRPQVRCCIPAGACASDPKGTDVNHFTARVQFFELRNSQRLSRSVLLLRLPVSVSEDLVVLVPQVLHGLTVPGRGYLLSHSPDLDGHVSSNLEKQATTLNVAALSAPGSVPAHVH